jgi:hypothetical protein
MTIPKVPHRAQQLARALGRLATTVSRVAQNRSPISSDGVAGETQALPIRRSAFVLDPAGAHRTPRQNNVCSSPDSRALSAPLRRSDMRSAANRSTVTGAPLNNSGCSGDHTWSHRRASHNARREVRAGRPRMAEVPGLGHPEPVGALPAQVSGGVNVGEKFGEPLIVGSFYPRRRFATVSPSGR